MINTRHRYWSNFRGDAAIWASARVVGGVRVLRLLPSLCALAVKLAVVSLTRPADADLDQAVPEPLLSQDTLPPEDADGPQIELVRLSPLTSRGPHQFIRLTLMNMVTHDW